MSIGPDGDAFPCKLIPVATLFEIWTCDTDESPFRQLAIPVPDSCRACCLRDRRFRCSGVCLLEHGSLDARSTYVCLAAHCFASGRGTPPGMSDSQDRAWRPEEA